MGTCPIRREVLSLPGERAPRLCGEGRERSPRGSWVSACGTRASLGGNRDLAGAAGVCWWLKARSWL